MNWLKRSLSIGFLSLLLMTGGITNARAQSLEVVFKSSLWGAGIGGVSGLALWALQDEDKEDTVFSKYIIKGMAFGVFAGMGVGIIDSQSGGDVFMSNGQPKGLLHYDAQSSVLAVSPVKMIPRPELDVLYQRPEWRVDLFTATF